MIPLIEAPADSTVTALILTELAPAQLIGEEPVKVLIVRLGLRKFGLKRA